MVADLESMLMLNRRLEDSSPTELDYIIRLAVLFRCQEYLQLVYFTTTCRRALATIASLLAHPPSLLTCTTSLGRRNSLDSRVMMCRSLGWPAVPLGIASCPGLLLRGLLAA